MPTNNVGFFSSNKRFVRARREYTVATHNTQDGSLEQQSLARVFWSGFFMPLRFVRNGVVWAMHHFPLKHIGHALRWFFLLPPLRFLGRILGFRYIRQSWYELRQVTWPTFKESRRLTMAVIFFSVVFGLLIAVVDFGLDKLFKQLLIK